MKMYSIYCVSVQNLLFSKNVVPEILIKILSTIQIAGFLNQAFLQSKSMKQPHFLYIDTNSQKLKVDSKVFVGYRQKCVWPIWSLNSKIECMSRKK